MESPPRSTRHSAIYCFEVFHVPFLAPALIGGGLGLHAKFGEALAGQLVSPARGLFVYSPVFIASLFGIWYTKAFRWYLIAIVILHWVLISSYPDWKGGWSIGPRYFSDLTPLLVYSLVPLFARGKLAAGAILLLCVPSFWIHQRCATKPGCMSWNAVPNEINQHEERLWEWRDPPFLR